MLNDVCYDAPVGTSDHPRTAQPGRRGRRRTHPDEFSAPSGFIGVPSARIEVAESDNSQYLHIYAGIRVTQLDRCAVAAVDEAKVADVAAGLLGSDEAGDLAEMFRLLGDPTRVRILFALLEAGELCVCDIAAVVNTSETKVSQAMRLLRGAGVVRNRRDGRNVYYRLEDAHVRLVLDLSREHLAHGGGAPVGSPSEGGVAT